MRILSTTLLAAVAIAMTASATFADDFVGVHRYPATQPPVGYPGTYGPEGYNRGWPQAEENNRAAMRLQDNLSSQGASQR